jgi:hypothetical protein
MKVLYAPEIDNILDGIAHNSPEVNKHLYHKFLDIYSVFSCIEPGENDEYRFIWIEAERGSIEAFGDYRDFKSCGEVKNRKEFMALWEEYYPSPTKWYRLQTAHFRDELYFYFGNKPIATINLHEEPEEKKYYNYEWIGKLIYWLYEIVPSEIEKLKADRESYNEYIRKNLPHSERIGRILRSDLWEILGNETLRPDLKLGSEMVEKLKEAVQSNKTRKRKGFDYMTAGLFFRVCEICYDANNYFKKTTSAMSPIEKYLAMADGRDAGLRSIDSESDDAFNEWFMSGRTVGAHPWEICRGGNSTHISLYLSVHEDQWFFSLAGSSIVRVEETVRMALVLHENKIPFELTDEEEIVRMVKGTDNVGIVPENITPRYCHSFFPKEDQIIDFMNLGWEKEIIPKIIEKAFWYPLDEIKLTGG